MTDVTRSSDNETLALSVDHQSQTTKGSEDNSSTSTEKRSDIPKPDAESQQGTSNANEQTKQHMKLVDPLRWFGILVPPALRTAQTSFIAAVEGPIPRLASLARDLRTQEIEIGRVKKQMKRM